MDDDCTSVSKREDVLRDVIAKGLKIDTWGKCLDGVKGRGDRWGEKNQSHKEGDIHG